MMNTSWEFWHRVDELRRGETLKDVCARAGLNYSSVLNRKAGADPSMPRLETAYSLAVALHTTVEYLLTGKGESPPRHTANDDIIARLDTASPEECNMVRRMLGLPVPERKSIEA